MGKASKGFLPIFLKSSEGEEHCKAMHRIIKKAMPCNNAKRSSKTKSSKRGKARK